MSLAGGRPGWGEACTVAAVLVLGGVIKNTLKDKDSKGVRWTVFRVSLHGGRVWRG